MKNPNYWLLVLFLLHALVPRYSSANPTAPTDISSLTESDGNEVKQAVLSGNSSSPAEHFHEEVVQAVLAGNFSYLTEKEEKEIMEAVLLTFLSGKDLSPKENDAIVQFTQKIQAIISGNFSSLTQNDKTEAMEAVLKTVLSENISSTTESDLKEAMQAVLSGNLSSPTENYIISSFQQKIQAVSTGNLSSLTESDAAEVIEAMLQAVLTGKISRPTDNDAMFQVQQKVQTVLSGNFSILTEKYVMDVIEEELEEKLSHNVSSPTKTDVTEVIEVGVEENLSCNVSIPCENFGKELIPAASSFSDSSPIVSGFIEGADLMIKMVNVLKGKVKGTEFDEIVSNLEKHIRTLPADLAENRASILESLYRSQDHIKRTKNILLIAADKLQSNCKDVIALFARKPNDASLRIIKYTAKKFARYVTSVKGMLDEADEGMEKVHFEISNCVGLIKDLFSTLEEAEKNSLGEIETKQQEIKIRLDDLNSKRGRYQENEKKRRSQNVILKLALIFLKATTTGSTNDTTKAIKYALDDHKAEDLEMKISAGQKELEDLEFKLDELNSNVKSIRNSNLAAKKVTKTVNEMTFSVNNEILLIFNWANTMTESLMADFKNKNNMIEEKEAIINRLNMLIKACKSYIGNELPSFLGSK